MTNPGLKLDMVFELLDGRSAAGRADERSGDAGHDQTVCSRPDAYLCA